MLIVNCPIQDDDLLLCDEKQTTINCPREHLSKKITDRDERNHHKISSKDVKRRKEEHRKSPSIERSVSVTVNLNSEQFDLRQLIKERRTDESFRINHRVVQILPKDNDSNVHRTNSTRASSSRFDKNQSIQKYHKH